jgi:carbon-monoxide dehydrogenase medium subunit
VKRLDYYAPESVDEAISILQKQGPGGRLLAGGTDVVVDMHEKGAYPSYIVSTRKLESLQKNEVHGDQANASGMRIGANTKCSVLEGCEVMENRLTAIWDGLRVIGSVQTRNMATVGGNCVTASPSADSAPGVVALDGVFIAQGPNGTREIAATDFFQGVRRTALQPNEVLTAIDVRDIPPRSGSAYRRHTPRKWMDLAFVGVAAWVQLGEDMNTIQDARVVLGAVAPTPVRSPNAEKILIGNAVSDELLAEAGNAARQDCSPITDVRATAEYRRYLVGVWTKRVLHMAVENARAGRHVSN